VTELLPQVDALVAAWLPGTEGAGVADGLTGAAPFTGRLSYAWPRANAHLPLGPTGGDPLFPLGFGLTG
jgi:beta-glucosidase